MINTKRFSNTSFYQTLLDDLEDKLNNSDDIDQTIGQLKPNHLPYLLVNGSIALAQKICSIQSNQIKNIDSLGMAVFKDERIEFLTPLLPTSAWKRLLFLRETENRLDLQQQILTALPDKAANSFIDQQCHTGVFTDLSFIRQGFDYDDAMRNAIHYKNHNAIKTLAIHASEDFCQQTMDDWYFKWAWNNKEDASPNEEISAEHEECWNIMKAVREQHILQSSIQKTGVQATKRKI